MKGRQRGKKRLIIVAVEIVKKVDGRNGMRQAYARVIPNASSKSFKPFFDDHISKEAKIITDVWQGYVPLKKHYQNWEQVKSDRYCSKTTSEIALPYILLIISVRELSAK